MEGTYQQDVHVGPNSLLASRAKYSQALVTKISKMLRRAAFSGQDDLGWREAPVGVPAPSFISLASLESPCAELHDVASGCLQGRPLYHPRMPHAALRHGQKLTST